MQWEEDLPTHSMRSVLPWYKNHTKTAPPPKLQTNPTLVLVVKNPPANAGDVRDKGSIPGSIRSTGGGNGNPLQCSCLENPMDWGIWWAHRVTKSQTQLKWFSTEHSTTCEYKCKIFQHNISKLDTMIY